MTEAIIVALITGGISLIGTLATTRSSAKSTQALVDYKLNQYRTETVDGETKLYRCVQAHTSQAGWEPHIAASLWTLAADPSEAWPAWIYPTGAHNAYALGAQVTHNGKRWRSTVANNVWEPGAYGWEEVTSDE